MRAGQRRPPSEGDQQTAAERDGDRQRDGERRIRVDQPSDRRHGGEGDRGGDHDLEASAVRAPAVVEADLQRADRARHGNCGCGPGQAQGEDRRDHRAVPERPDDVDLGAVDGGEGAGELPRRARRWVAHGGGCSKRCRAEARSVGVSTSRLAAHASGTSVTTTSSSSAASARPCVGCRAASRRSRSVRAPGREQRLTASTPVGHGRAPRSRLSAVTGGAWLGDHRVEERPDRPPRIGHVPAHQHGRRSLRVAARRRLRPRRPGGRPMRASPGSRRPRVGSRVRLRRRRRRRRRAARRGCGPAGRHRSRQR